MLAFIYIILLWVNLLIMLKGKKSRQFYIVTLIFLFFLMCGHQYKGNGDSRDFYGYFIDYYRGAQGEYRDFPFYYLFYITQKIAQSLSMTFYQWWAAMTAFSLLFISWVFRKFEIRHQCFLVYFMSYFIFIFYTGLKFYYGFCLLLCAVCYLVRGKEKDDLRFSLFVLLAGGMHALYYPFLLLLLIRSKVFSPQKIFIISMTLCLVMFTFGKVGITNFLQNLILPILDTTESNNLRNYFLSRVNFGYLIPVSVHLLTLFYLSRVKYLSTIRKGSLIDNRYANRLYDMCLLLTLLYPLYMFSLTFTRLLTAFVLCALSISYSCIKDLQRKDIHRLFIYSWPPMMIYFIYNIIMSDYWTKSVIPLFQTSFFRNIFISGQT